MITQDNVKTIKAANVQNIIKKAAAGKTLTKQELEILEANTDAAGVPKGRLFKNLKGAASGMKDLRLTVPILRKCIDLGCPAIRANGSVDETAFREWWPDHADEALKENKRDRVYWQTLKAKEDYVKARDFNKTQASILIPKSDVCQSIGPSVSEAVSIMRQVFENELPVECAGLDTAAIRERNKRGVAKVCGALQTLADHWPAEMSSKPHSD